MAKRLIEEYALGDLVEISLAEEGWLPGRVVGRQHPGVWVATDQGLWFVTNRRRIRKQSNKDQNST